MNRGIAIELFEQVHQPQLRDAHFNLQRRHIPYWRIALKERMSAISDDPTVIDTMMFVVTLKLDRHGRLEVADETSQKAIDDWERRYVDAFPCEFTIPMFWEEKA